MKLLAAPLLILVALPVHACRVRHVSPQEKLAASQEVHLGVLTRVHLLSLEQAVTEARDYVVEVGGVREGRVTVFRTIRGLPRTAIDAPLPRCGPSHPELQHKVVVLAKGATLEVSNDPELVRLVEGSPGGL